MDKYLYVAMSGAKETLRAQAVNSHNLANASTTGFRADLAAFQTRAVEGSGHASRAYATNATIGWDTTNGALLSTGRDLDVAVQGEGWIAVQAADGSEAYTRAGDLRVDTAGALRNGAGDLVLGDGGPITVPQNSSVLVGADGLFRMQDGSAAPADASVQLASGVLESSNVNAAGAMVEMIELARRFELQVKAIRTAEEDGATAARLLRV
jgi:flagellar basal-body rod protein FlgF